MLICSREIVTVKIHPGMITGTDIKIIKIGSDDDLKNIPAPGFSVGISLCNVLLQGCFEGSP